MKYIVADSAITKMTPAAESQPDSLSLLKKKGERIKALHALLKIGEKKPILTIVAIAGLEQELKTIRSLLKKSADSTEEQQLGLRFG